MIVLANATKLDAKTMIASNANAGCRYKRKLITMMKDATANPRKRKARTIGAMIHDRIIRVVLLIHRPTKLAISHPHCVLDDGRVSPKLTGVQTFRKAGFIHQVSSALCAYAICRRQFGMRHRADALGGTFCTASNEAFVTVDNEKNQLGI
jgi:hypothetical protein